jgi:hypothetical protein
MTSGAIQKELIRIVYPTDGGRIALGTEGNLDSNIEGALHRTEWVRVRIFPHQLKASTCDSNSRKCIHTRHH